MTSVIIVLIGIVAMYCLGGGRQARAVGFALNILNQLIWIIYALWTAQYPFIVGAVIFGAVAARNLWRLRRGAPPVCRDGRAREG